MKYLCLLLCNLLICSFLTNILHAQQLAPSIEWQKCLGGTGDDKAYSMARTMEGGYILAGTSTSNDGDVTGHHGSLSTTDAWIVKLKADGTIRWQRSLGGSLNDAVYQVINTSDGGYIGVGETASNDGDVSGNHNTSGDGTRDIWVVKLDPDGNLQWQKCLGGSNDDYGKSIKQTTDSGYILTGSTASKDGDVSGSSYTASSAVWVVKLDQSGTIQWQNTFGVQGNNIGYDLLPLVSGEYLVAAGGDQSFNVSYANPPNAYLGKIGSNGQLLQAVWIGSRSSSYGLKQINQNQYFLLTDLLNCYPNNPNDGFVIRTYDTSFVAGTYYENFSYCDPGSLNIVFGYGARGSGSMALLSDGTGVIAATTSDTSHLGNHGGPADGLLSSFYPLTWKKCYGGSGDDEFQGIVAGNDYKYVAAGFTSSNNGDVSGNHGGFDFWVVKFSNINMIKGTVFLDYNLNGMKDGNEPLVNNILVQSVKGSITSGSSTYMGMFHNTVDTGMYTTSVLTPLPYYTPVPAQIASTFNSYNNTDSLSFALQPVPGKRDYELNLFNLNSLRPGIVASYRIEVVNVGTDTLLNRSVKMIKDHRLQFLSAVPAPISTSGDTLLWNVVKLSPRDTVMINLQMMVPTPPLVNLGDTLQSMAIIDTTGDLNPGNNSSFIKQPVWNSFDPNGKLEVNGGTIHPNDIASGKNLLYTIFFQNTGTDTAFSIVLKDTLGNKVDPATLEMVGASHPYQLSIQNGNILTWTFSNILLPDSSQNKAASQGYVAYRIKPLSNDVVGDSIRNKASIYFDYNLPVLTNTQLTVVTAISLPLLPPVPAILGLDSNYCNNTEVQSIRIANIPPASANVIVTVKIDNVLSPVSTDGSFTILPSSLSPGVHRVAVVYSNAAGTDSAAWNFGITAAVTPRVTLSSSVAINKSPVYPVTLTAANTSGGGNSPLFTFAKDNDFMSIWQSESSLNTLTVDSAMLRVGRNPVYVRMRTSDTCYTTQTAVDSIILVLDSVASVNPIDSSLQEINVSPNPITDRINITGLQPSRAYTLSLLNVNGQQMIIQQVAAGQNNYLLITGTLPKGIYLLRIFDGTSHRMVGLKKLVAL